MTSETVTLDPIAAAKLDEHLQHSKAKALRLAVKGGGCSGFEYKLYLDDPKEEDHVFESQGQTVICDPVSLTFVKGSLISYHEDLQESGFRVENPNANGGCGCGSSFYV